MAPIPAGWIENGVEMAGRAQAFFGGASIIRSMAEPPSQSGPIQSSAIQSIPRRYVKRGIEGALLEALDGGAAPSPWQG
jgi:hypothetical protein